VFNVEETTCGAARRAALDRLLTDTLPVRQNLEGALAAFLAEVSSYQRLRARWFNRQVKRKPFLRSPTGAAHRAINGGFFTLLIELFLLLRVAWLDKANRDSFKIALPLSFCSDFRK